MKHSFLTTFAFCVAGLVAALTTGCGAQTLDGGSNTPTASSSSGASGSTEQDPAGSSGSGTTSGGTSGTTPADGLPTTPMLGTVKGKAFAPTAFDLEKDPAGAWILTAHNAAKTSCAKERALGADITFITVQKVTPAKGLSGKDTYASFQVGFYMSGADTPDTKPATTTTLRLDSWSDEPGATVKGAMHVANDESDVAGTFTATICASAN